MNINYIPSAANFITIVFKDKNQASDCANFLLRNGIIIRELGSFGLPKCLRITIGNNQI